MKVQINIHIGLLHVVQIYGETETRFSFFCSNLNFYNINWSPQYLSWGQPVGGPNHIVPVISLETNIKTLGQDESGVWQLKVD